MIDFHTHIGRLGPDNTTTLSAAELVRKMDDSGIAKSVVLPLHDSPHGWYLSATTEDVIRECSRFPGRLIPFCQIDPRFGYNSPDTDFRGLLREYRQRGCLGMGEVIANMYYDDPMVINLMRQCGEVGFPVVIHGAHRIGGTYGLVDDKGLPRLEKLLRECPDTILCMHGPAWWSEIGADVTEKERGGYPKGPVNAPGRVVELLETYPNLYGDLSAESGYNALTRSEHFGYEFLETFQDKLLFATDTMRYSMDETNVKIIPYFRHILEKGCISPEAHAKIASKNAERILGL